MQPSTNQSPQVIDSTATTVDNQIDAKQQGLAHLAQDTRFRMKRSTEDLIQIGTNLIEAKKLCEHGEWLPWLEREFTDEYALTHRSAQHYMNVAQKFGDKYETVSYLPIAATALYMLSVTSVPDEAREEAITRAAAGETISKKKANQIIKQYTSVSKETQAKGESLGLPTRGDSILPQSDRIDDLTHVSPADVDDRPGVLPLTPFEILKNSARRGIQGYLSSMTEAAVAQALVNVTTQAPGWECHVDAVAHRFPRRDRVALRPAIIKVFWEVAQGRKTLTQSVDVMLPDILIAHDEDEYSPDTVQAELGNDPEVAIAPTPAQWRTAQVKHAELLQALKDAQTEIEQLTAENLKLHEANGGLHDKIAQLKAELAAVK